MGRIEERLVMNKPKALAADRLCERPVGPADAAAFLRIARSTVMALARAGKIPAHPVTNGRRKRWLFFVSELAGYVRSLGVNCDRHPCAIEEEVSHFEAHT